MRIIGGAFKGKRLSAFKGQKIRPTSDRVKEALFNIIVSQIKEGIKVLDLYAGTGNIGIEALSQGASAALFVENDRKAIELLRKNLEHCGITDKAEIISRDVLRAIAEIEARDASFNIIFLDPPYGRGLPGMTMKLLGDSSISTGALIIVEHSRREELEEKYGRFFKYDSRKYGDTSLSFFSEREKH